MRIYLTYFDPEAWMTAFLADVQGSLEALGPRYLPASSPATADVILYMAPYTNRFRSWTRRLLEDETIARYPNRCFVYDLSDRPITFLPGLYTSLPRVRIAEERIRVADRWMRISEPIERDLLKNVGAKPKLFFSFRGSLSAEVRREIFAANFGRDDVVVSRTHRWWDYSDEEEARVSYLSEIRDSAFVLCPRGAAPPSYRLYETMQLGRVPVILSDELVLSSGPPWQDFSVRISERRVSELPEILEPMREHAAEMGQAARAAWENWMKPGPVLLRRWLQSIEEILHVRPPDWDEADVRARWRSQAFQWQNGIHPVQGLHHALRTGTVRERLRGRFGGYKSRA
jgi:hypothetical protein